MCGEPDLRAEVVHLFGEVTLQAAERDRDSLADMDGAAWDRLVAGYALLSTAEDKRAAVADLDESTRRRLVLVLLDVNFLGAAALAAVEAM